MSSISNDPTEPHPTTEIVGSSMHISTFSTETLLHDQNDPFYVRASRRQIQADFDLYLNKTRESVRQNTVFCLYSSLFIAICDYLIPYILVPIIYGANQFAYYGGIVNVLHAVGVFALYTVTIVVFVRCSKNPAEFDSLYRKGRGILGSVFLILAVLFFILCNFTTVFQSSTNQFPNFQFLLMTYLFWQITNCWMILELHRFDIRMRSIYRFWIVLLYTVLCSGWVLAVCALRLEFFWIIFGYPITGIGCIVLMVAIQERSSDFFYSYRREYPQKHSPWSEFLKTFVSYSIWSFVLGNVSTLFLLLIGIQAFKIFGFSIPLLVIATPLNIAYIAQLVQPMALMSSLSLANAATLVSASGVAITSITSYRRVNLGRHFNEFFRKNDIINQLNHLLFRFFQYALVLTFGLLCFGLMVNVFPTVYHLFLRRDLSFDTYQTIPAIFRYLIPLLMMAPLCQGMVGLMAPSEYLRGLIIGSRNSELRIFPIAMVVAGVQLGIVYLVIQLILVKITSPLIFAAVILFYQGTIVPLITFLIILFFCNLYVKQTFNLTTLLLSLLPLVAATCWFVLILVLS